MSVYDEYEMTYGDYRPVHVAIALDQTLRL